jgi:dienelactone hydrolase
MTVSPMVFVTVVLAGAAASVSAQQPDPAKPESRRDLNTHHCLTPPKTRGEWEERARMLRTQILASAGLWPMPARTPLRPIVTGRTEREDFIVENVSIETLPGFRLCGSLYRPKGKKGPFPAIANPHGHWAHGRLEMEPDVERAAPPPAQPAEGRANLVAIGVNLARQGFVVFAYDMVGYNDTSQVSHQFAGRLDRWFNGVSLMGLQLWNSIRAVDYLCSLRDVDRNRIGVTGASGGGTQTFLLSAVDDRVKAAVPVNMVSAYMQGGCLCENGPGLRLGTDNVEIAALTAPRPLLVIAATGDWTKSVPAEEWPAIKAVYDLYGAGDRTACVQFNYGHNYNVESREAMYAWFARWLGKDGQASPREKPFQLDPSAMRVWTEQHPAPKGLLAEDDLAEAMIERSRGALLSIWPTQRADLRRFRDKMRPALATMLAMSDLTTPIRAASWHGGKAILIVTTDGEAPSEAQALLDAVRTDYAKVQQIAVPSTVIDPKTWWADYRSCYNPTPLAIASRKVAEELRNLAASYSRVDIVGLGSAGLPTVFARAIAPVKGAIVADLAAAGETDDARLRTMYAPCLAALGGVGTALAIISPMPIVLNGAGRTVEAWLPGPRFQSTALTVSTFQGDTAEIVDALRRARLP